MRTLGGGGGEAEKIERLLRERLDALGPAPCTELLHVLMLPDFERVDRIGEFWSLPPVRPQGLAVELRAEPIA